MKKSALLYGVFAVATTLSAIGVRGAPRDPDNSPPGRENQAERVIIKFRLNTAAHQRTGLLARNGHVSVRAIPQLDLHAIRIPRGKTAAEVMARYEHHPLVEFVELETFAEPTTTPDDPAFANWQMLAGNAGMEPPLRRRLRKPWLEVLKQRRTAIGSFQANSCLGPIKRLVYEELGGLASWRG